MSHQYKHLPPEDMEALRSTFLIDSWSYSKVNTFARHEKAYEMQYIFGLYSRMSSTTIAGKAYHRALEVFFTQLKEGTMLDIVDLERSAFEYIATVRSNQWKLGKTTPTVEEAVNDALTTVGKLLRNFYGEKMVYLDDIGDILGIEMRFDEFLTVNGVDIPIPCHGVVDLVVKTRLGKRAIIDHKSKVSFTDDKESALAIGPQAMTYALLYEAKTGEHIDEVWFMENKSSQNKDKSAQIKAIVVALDDNTRRLYEALLYEPLKKMIGAVRDPDYVYLINSSDKLIDMAEVYDFWTRTQICEVEDFNVEEGKKELIAKRLKKIRDASGTMISPEIIKRFREKAANFIQYDLSIKDMTQQEKIEHVLRTFGITSRVAHTFEGYSSNTFLLEISAGVKVASIYKYRLDMANALDVENVRLSNDLVVYQGKSYLSVDISKKRDRFLYFNPDDRVGVKLPVGRDNYGNVIVWDLNNQSTPHVLVCGATGSGKSVWLRSIIEYAKEAGVQNIIILDTKDSLGIQSGPGVDVIVDIDEIEEAMEKAVTEMNRRVKTKESELALIVFDEFADAVANGRSGNALKVYDEVMVATARGFKMERRHTETKKSLEENLRILLQKGRSAGFRIVAATQRASVKVITGDAKVNFPVQVCFRVPKEADSRVVLDEAGAESLAGDGDGLIKSPEYRDTVRFQAYYKPQNAIV